MSQKQKLEELIKKILKEELDEKNVNEEEKEFVTSDGTGKTATPQQRRMITKAKAGDTIKYRKAGMSTTSTTGGTMQEETEEEKVANTEVLESMPTGTEIAGKISEILDALSKISEGGKDDKHKKHAAKVMKAMESAKAAIEALTAHEMVLEEKEKEAQEKDGHKHLKAIEKHLGKLIKDKDSIQKIMKKMPVEKVLDMKKKLVDKELDEEKLAKVMLKHSLKEAQEKA